MRAKGFLRGRRIGRISKLLGPDWYSWCHKCKTTYFFVDSHNTYYGGGRGIFALCEKCWEELVPSERLPYYRKVVDMWESLTPGDGVKVWNSVEKAVLGGG